MTKQEIKDFLKSVYPSYDTKHHDAYVISYNKYLDARALWEYETNRGISNKPEPLAKDYAPLTFNSRA